MTFCDNAVAVVTGGAGGIGGAISRRLAARGDHLILNDIDEEAAQRAARDIRAAGGECDLVIGDITDAAIVTALYDAVAVRGGAEWLVNNVGDFRPASRSFLHSTPEQWRALLDINLWHVFAVTHALLPGMLERGSGGIVNVSTVEAYRGIPAHAAYSAFKAGVSAFTKSLAVEVGGSGVRVNAIAPDLTDTDQTPAAAMLRGRDPELTRHWLPVGRFGRPDDAASVVAFLLSPDASFVTGHTIPVDGGTLSASGWFPRADGKGWSNMPDRP
ncbi:SDR family NAD(P)-dependent oxidoreductase [Salinibacterium sp. ZJ70]|uniref:SDR family NAD(P)-dependent oxidoreductase n=1 Tax=Salinibacterium sp. ZJ70 TaxID=2708084 RepID=UPI00141DF0B1|nr:SDR family NAD(P)-dependent oxidoreductase [Salinibacterium sp. ZJ70]